MFLADVVKRFEVDERLTLCHVWQRADGVVAGFVEMPQYRDVLRAAGFDVSAVKLLPEESGTPDRFGIVTVDHVPLRESPKDAPGDRDNVSDLTLGEPVWILDRKADGATLVHAGDGYLGWVSASMLRVVDAAEWARYEPSDAWRTKTSGTLFDLGAVAPRVIAERLSLAMWAQTFKDTPYLWGGKTRAGLDCSGLVQTCFARHGIALPRDADQQANVGRLVATRRFVDALAKGDLLFFVSPHRGNVHHVAIYLGQGKYIEAAGDSVRIRSMTPGDVDYDSERMRTFGWARRVIE